MRDERGERLVALKRIRADRRSDPELITSFQREVQISSLLRHPNIVALESWGEDGDGLFLATEYVDGRSAAELTRRLHAVRATLPLEAAYVLLLDVAAGLAHAHSFDGERGAVVHRDVAADNVLVSYEGEAKLADFGIAKISGSTAHTATGTIKGKCAYLAPEVLRGDVATPSSDVYAFGILAHRILTGMVPFRGSTDAEIIQAALFATPPPLRTLRPDLPEKLSALLDACISKSAVDRPASAQQLIDALPTGSNAIAYRTMLARVMERHFPRDGDELRTEISRAIGMKRSSTVSLRPPRPQPRAGRGRAAAAAAALVVVALTGAVLWRSSRTAQAVPTAPVPVSSATPATIRPGDPLQQKDANTTGAEAIDPNAQPVGSAVVPDPKSLIEPPRRTPKPATKRARIAAESARSAAAAAREPAFIQVLVYPWAEVFIDGTRVGVSPPLPPQKVTPGRHSIILVNPELNVRRTYVVHAQAGKVSPLKAVLTK